MALPAHEASRASARIAERLLDTEYILQADCVHAYWPIHEKREVDITAVIRSLASRGTQVLLPVVEHVSAGHVEMTHRPFSSESDLVLSDLGILEPKRSPAIDPSCIDVVLVPAMAVDGRGNRIGYGLGFYDRFLSKISAKRICPIYDRDLVHTVPSDPHDQRMDIIVTEHRTLTIPRT